MKDEELIEFIEKNFFPLDYFDKKVNIIGLGATGTRVVLNLSKMGFNNFCLWDFDKVERRNINNQIFKASDIDKFKVDAVDDLIKEFSGSGKKEMKITKNKVFFDGTKEKLSGVVFLLVDTMEARKIIWKNGIKNNKDVDLMIETRIRQESGDVFFVDPSNPEESIGWERYTFRNFPQRKERLFLINPVVEIIAGMAIWGFLKFLANDFFKKNYHQNRYKIENRVSIYLKDGFVIEKEFF